MKEIRKMRKDKRQEMQDIPMRRRKKDGSQKHTKVLYYNLDRQVLFNQHSLFMNLSRALKSVLNRESKPAKMLLPLVAKL